ncbi:hypothetical protein LUZ60_006834 [Juncus effusus]|nr:hypothetical protein LUZ60_006834 [Juncus effusus]
MADPSTSSSSSTSALALSTNPNPKPKPAPKRFIHSQIPAALLSNPALNAAISLLPSAYDFEIHKTLHRISASSARRAALQLPDGLLMFSLPLCDIFSEFAASKPGFFILADPTYGACCLADTAAASLSCDLLVHYGHSCLVPVTSSLLPVLYVFVDIRVDAARLAETIEKTFPDPSVPIALAGTIQFVSAVHAAREILSQKGYDKIHVPQSKPLSAGEVLGCTAPTVPKSKNVDSVIFVADGRFHLEAFMIANPKIKAFRYDPFLGVLVLEQYDHEGMKKARKNAILESRKAKSWGIVLGTLGRQGSVKVLDRVLEHMEEKGLDYTIVLMSEISPQRINLFDDSIEAWVQIACPRLSIDWGEGFKKPLLTTFEFDVALGYVKGWWEMESRICESREMDSGICKDGGCVGCDCGDEKPEYPMDYYAQDGGEWNSCYMKKKASGRNRVRAVEVKQ